ncbi:ANTAR domain-containing protein [Sedimentibacter sp.]|uniref:ANTAR domain-containing response regulator n=1 Tax=Sedimentibacter sp. TaxID=1960295 RepID=UPI0028A67053|nr:ANTAR domain-containing protein [Sedimentibacter sp.]
MDSVLIVSNSDKGITLLTQLLNDNGITKITSVKSGAEVRRLINMTEFDLTIIITPLPDEFGDNLAITITEISTSGVILITKHEVADEIEAKVEDYGILVVSNPIVRQVFYQAQKLALATKKRLSGLKNENIRLQNKIEEIRLVTRAKCVLIEYLNMTENQAHKYIEKQAMDLRTPRKEIAQNILKAYET